MAKKLFGTLGTGALRARASGMVSNEAILDKVAKGEKNYWFTFVADSATVLFFLFWEIRFHDALLLHVAAAWSAGYIAWTLTEYCFHRWVYHLVPSIFRDGHAIHHEAPLTLIALPWIITTTVMASLWYLCSVVFHIPLVLAVLSGWLVGFVSYSLVHHGLHHWNLKSRWSRRLKAYHRIHHHFPDYNYGVTMSLWDRVFGTTYRKPQTRVDLETGEDLQLAAALPSRSRATVHA